MRKYLMLVVGLIGFAIYAGAATSDLPILDNGRTWAETQGINQVILQPTDAGSGMSLKNIEAWRLTVCADQPSKYPDGGSDGGAAALMGTGTIRLYAFEPFDGGWGANPTLDLAQNKNGVICQPFPDVPVGVKYGRVYAMTDSLAVDGGPGTVTIRINGQVSK